MTKKIVVNDVDVDLLREQRNTLSSLHVDYKLKKEEQEHIDGIVNLLDNMLDIAEGFNIN